MTVAAPATSGAALGSPLNAGGLRSETPSAIFDPGRPCTPETGVPIMRMDGDAAGAELARSLVRKPTSTVFDPAEFREGFERLREIAGTKKVSIPSLEP